MRINIEKKKVPFWTEKIVKLVKQKSRLVGF